MLCGMDRRQVKHVVGIDPSVRRTGLVAVPADWRGDWSRVSSSTIGVPLQKDAGEEVRARRNGEIAREVIRFAERFRAKEVWIESYAYASATAAHTLGELGGVVRLELVRAGIRPRVANMSTARKLLLGKVPRGREAVADEVKRVVRDAGGELETDDERMAFVVANYALSLVKGADFFARRPGAELERLRRSLDAIVEEAGA